jgi:predicted flavoprotein YhiN
MIKKRLVVIGGGAAGFFCAVNAARLYPSLEVISKENVAETEVNIENITNKDKTVFCPVCGSIIEYTK